MGVVCPAHPRTSVTICDPASFVFPLSAFTEILNEGRSLSDSLKISLTLRSMFMYNSTQQKSRTFEGKIVLLNFKIANNLRPLESS